jgi:hypothetical protein
MKEGKPVMPSMHLSTSARSKVDKSDLRNSKKIHVASHALMPKSLWLLAATAGKVTKHTEGILQQQYQSLLGWVGVSILVFVPTNIHGLCMETDLTTSPRRRKRTNGIVVVLFYDSFELGLFARLAFTYCVLALSMNDLASIVDICSLSYKDGTSLQIVLQGGGATMQLGAMLAIEP